MITSLHKFIAARKRSLGQGNIFTRVCHSVQGSGSVEGGGLCLGGRGGLCHGNIRYCKKRAVHDLLECIFV